MLTRQEVATRQQQAYEFFHKAGLFIRNDEKATIEIVDFDLDNFEETGLGVLVYVNTDRCCAKELAMWPRQTCPEHMHPPVGSDPGKEETFRCRWGKAFLYVSGEKASSPKAVLPKGCQDVYTAWNEITLGPGDQYTLVPGTVHWFQAGVVGAVVSEFSTRSTDENDVFTDPKIRRITKIGK